MSDASAVNSWLRDRRPPPPAELARRMERAVPAESHEGDAALADRAMAALAEARGAPGRVRESAFHLLTADALLTYASHAALEAPDPQARLEALVARAASPEL